MQYIFPNIESDQQMLSNGNGSNASKCPKPWDVRGLCVCVFRGCGRSQIEPKLFDTKDGLHLGALFTGPWHLLVGRPDMLRKSMSSTRKAIKGVCAWSPAMHQRRKRKFWHLSLTQTLQWPNSCKTGAQQNFPAGPAVKNLPCNAETRRFDPWLGN